MSVATFDRRTSAMEMQDGRSRAWRIGPDTFKVYGRAADQYEVKVYNGIPLCPCEAGIRGRACWHAALVLARLEREAGGRDEVVAIDLSDLTQPARVVDGPARCERKRAPR